MLTATTRRPDRSPGGLLLLIGIAAAATLPLGCAAPAWRNLLAALAAVGAGIVFLRNPGPRPVLTPLQLAVAVAAAVVLLLHAGLTAAGKLPDATAITEAFAFRTGFIAFGFAAVIAVRDPRSRRIVAVAATLTALFQVAHGLLAPDPLSASSISSSGRLRGTFSSGNSFGSFLALVLPLLAGWLPGLARDRGLSARRILNDLQNGTVRRLLPLAALAAALFTVGIGLVLSGSRGALLAALGGTTLALSPFLQTRGRLARATVPLAVLGAVTALLLSGGRFDAAVSRWENLAPRLAKEDTTGRSEIWRQLAPLLDEYPFGVGIGSLRVVAHTVQPEPYGAARLLEAHNDPYELLLEFGLLPGLVMLGALTLLVLPPLLRTPGGMPGVRAGMAGAVLAGLLHSLVDFNLLWRPGVLLWFLLILGGLLRDRPTPTPKTPVFRLTLALVALIAALASAFLSLQHFRAEWWRERTGGRRDAAMTWLIEPGQTTDAMPLPRLAGMTADAAARMAAAWLTLRDRVDQEALDQASSTDTGNVPVTGIFFARQFRWSEHASEYATLAANADRVLAQAPGNSELRLVRDMAASRAWLASPSTTPAPHLPFDPKTTSRLLRIRAAYASLWLNHCRRDPAALPTARLWLDSLPPTHPARRLLEAENADMLRSIP